MATGERRVCAGGGVLGTPTSTRQHQGARVAIVAVVADKCKIHRGNTVCPWLWPTASGLLRLRTAPRGRPVPEGGSPPSCISYIVQ